MARTLVGGISATQENVTLSAGLTAQPGDLFKIDSEVVQFGGYGSIGRLKDFTHKRVIFHRGVGETTAATHANGAAVVGVADSLVAGTSEAQPSPFASAGQASNANLTAFSGLSLVADRLPYANGTGTLSLATFTAAGRAILDDANAAAQLATLGAAAAPDFATATSAIATDESTTSGGFTDLATPGPSVTVTIGATGKAELVLTADIINETAGNASYLAMVISGASTVAAAQMLVDRNGAAYTSTRSRTVIITGLTPGATTFKMQYAAGGGTAAHFSNRSLIVKPVF